MARNNMVFVECRYPSGQYFGANYPETTLPAVYALLRKRGVTTVTLNETTEVALKEPTMIDLQPFRVGDWVRVVRCDPGDATADCLPIGSEGKLWRYEPSRGRRCWYVCEDGKGWGWCSSDELKHLD